MSEWQYRAWGEWADTLGPEYAYLSHTVHLDPSRSNRRHLSRESICVALNALFHTARVTSAAQKFLRSHPCAFRNGPYCDDGIADSSSGKVAGGQQSHL